MTNFKNIRIGEVLIDYGYITREQLEDALAYQKENKGKRLGGILIELGFINEAQMLEALAQRVGLEIVEISQLHVDAEAVAKVPQPLAEKYDVLAVSQRENVLTVVTNDPLNFYGLEDIRQTTAMELELYLSELVPLQRAISYYYSEVAAKKAAKEANTTMGASELEEIDLDEGDGDTPVINLLNSLIQRAYSTNASDVHIEPFEKQSMVRMRIDGTIVDYVTLQKNIHPPLVARIKILSNLDIAERRIPQDGHFRMKVEEQFVNIRVSVIPTIFGEKVVLRLLSGNAAIDHSGTYGMIDEDYKRFKKILQSPNGIIYMTGPTGSGKTTTLYMILEELSKRQVNISTIEDPVEKNMLRVNQMQVNNMAGLTFDVGLRALLRQDPDIIMVGETRDSETASISIRAAITGHLVLSTLHTNNAAASIVRLIDMGMEPYMISSALVGVVAQRLMRKLCKDCSYEDEPTEAERQVLGEDITRIRRSKGCPRCNNTGYRGRVAIHEIIAIDKEIRKMITKGSSVEEIMDYAMRTQGTRPLGERARELVDQGVTSVEELLKIAYYS